MRNRTFEIIGIIVIAVLVACHTAHGDETNTWDPLFELYHNDFGPNNPEAGKLSDEYETILYILDTLNEDCEFYLDTASDESKLQMEWELTVTLEALESVLEAITIFVNGHKGV